jgi:hypothetical protein
MQGLPVKGEILLGLICILVLVFLYINPCATIAALIFLGIAAGALKKYD